MRRLYPKRPVGAIHMLMRRRHGDSAYKRSTNSRRLTLVRKVAHEGGRCGK